MTSPITNHPITTRFHQSFGIRTKVESKGNSHTPNHLREFANSMAKVLIEPDSSMIDSLQSSLKRSFNSESALEKIGASLNKVTTNLVKQYSDHKKSSVLPDFDHFNSEMLSIENGFKNTIALFMGMFLVFKELGFNLNTQYPILIKAAKIFLKDLAHMQMGLFFLIYNKLGVNSFPQNCYQFEDIKKYFTFDNGRINLRDSLIEDVKNTIGKTPKANGEAGYKWVGNSSFHIGTGTNSYYKQFTFDSDVPATNCPTIYTPVETVEGEKSLIDITLDWIQKVLDQTLKPELERLESKN